MAKKANTLTVYVKRVHDALCLANFMAYHAEDSAKRESSAMQKSIKPGNGTYHRLIGSRILGINIYSSKYSFVSYGGAMAKDKDLIDLIAEANGMTQADAIATAYEAVELFVKAILVEYLYCRRGEVPLDKITKSRIKKQFGKKASSENTKPWFGQVVSVLASQNCDPLFDILYRRLPGLHDRVTKFSMCDLTVNHKTVEFIRHAKTHMNGRVDKSRLTKQPAEVQKRVAHTIRKSFLHEVPWFLPSYDLVREFITREAEFTQILYDAITTELAMVLDWTPGCDPSTGKALKT